MAQVTNKANLRTLKSAASLNVFRPKGPVSKGIPWGRCKTVEGSKNYKRKQGGRYT